MENASSFQWIAGEQIGTTYDNYTQFRDPIERAGLGTQFAPDGWDSAGGGARERAAARANFNFAVLRGWSFGARPIGNNMTELAVRNPQGQITTTWTRANSTDSWFDKLAQVVVIAGLAYLGGAAAAGGLGAGASGAVGGTGLSATPGAGLSLSGASASGVGLSASAGSGLTLAAPTLTGTGFAAGTGAGIIGAGIGASIPAGAIIASEGASVAATAPELPASVSATPSATPSGSGLIPGTGSTGLIPGTGTTGLQVGQAAGVISASEAVSGAVTASQIVSGVKGAITIAGQAAGTVATLQNLGQNLSGNSATTAPQTQQLPEVSVTGKTPKLDWQILLAALSTIVALATLKG